MCALLRRVATYINHHGAMYTIKRAAEKAGENLLGRYDRVWQRNKADEAELARQRANPVEGVGLISILIPVYNTRPDLLRALADSLIAQTYSDWEACLYDGMSPREDTRAMLREIAALDHRIRVVEGDTNEGISGNTNKALDMARGQWIALCDHDDLLSPDAMYRVAACIRDENPDMIYSDEDKVNEAGTLHTTPHYKPDFCPDNLCSGNYVCHLMVLRRALVEKAGRLRPAFDGSQDHDLALRCSEHTSRIAHIPHVLYHWRTLGTSMSHQNLQKCLNASCRAVEEHIGRLGYPGEVKQEKGAIRIRYETNPDATVDVIVVDSGDPERWKRTVFDLKTIMGEGVRFMVVSPWEDAAKELGAPWVEWVSGESVYTVMNRAAALCTADYIFFHHGTVGLEEPEPLKEMIMYAQREDVGAVTPVLTTTMGRIVHGGFALGMEKTVQCRARGQSYRAGGWHDIMRTSHNVAAVSAACLMIRRDHFIPFDENYTGGLGAVDWCLRLHKMGLHHVFTPHARGVCQDSLTRRWLLLEKGPDAQDAARFAKTWGEVHDPCYSPRFSRKKANYALPADR